MLHKETGRFSKKQEAEGFLQKREDGEEGEPQNGSPSLQKRLRCATIGKA